ncbi:thrombomodulin-like [Spinachia spinachia]
MAPSARTLLSGALVLCALGESLPARSGHCAGDRCFALFPEPEDFEGARRRCRDFGGDLYALDEHAGDMSTVRGSYWVSSNETAPEETEAGLRRCPFLPDREHKLQWDPCTSPRHGSRCQYTITEPCVGLPAGAGARVNYTTPMGFRADDLKAFPPGTIAVTSTAGGVWADSKHVCFSMEWRPAPWSCEVFGGGCDHHCSSESKACVCPAGTILHHNNISCTVEPCQADPCTAQGQECKSTNGGSRCVCRDGFVEEDGGCVNVTICEKCEHMQCDKINGVYQCGCNEGFVLAAHDPTKCELVCTEQDCPARCDSNNPAVCYCPNGYIDIIRDGRVFCTAFDTCEMQQCDHLCDHLPSGDYQCLCNEGFKLQRDRKTCVPTSREEEEEEGGGSGGAALPLQPNPGSSQPPAVSSYVKTGSVLGISSFVALCAALVFLLIRCASKRCGRFQISSIKHQDIDIFYLQQVTSETYKRLSLDKQSKSDS